MACARAALMAGRGQRLRQRTAGPFGRHGGEAARRRALVAACASTGRARRGRRARSSGVGRQRCAARQQGSERGSGAARHARRARLPTRARRAERGGSAREGERRERKGVERENKSQRFDLVQTQDFQLKLEKF